MTCSQAFGNLWQCAEPHVGEPCITGDRPADGDTCDTGWDDDVDGSERITSPDLVEERPKRLNGSGPWLRGQNSTHDRHGIG